MDGTATGMVESRKLKALGIHVFAGGFTIGVKDVMDVTTHLEVHDFAARTAREVVGVNVHRSDAAKWPDAKEFADHTLAFGNPRCTAFSCVTGGCDREAHGAFGKQTRDAIEFCQYASGNFDFVIWESVQQAYSTGKPLLDKLYTELFEPKGYKLCHLFVNAASFGNTQNRKRYFFVAYRDHFKFNVQPPPMLPYQPVLWDALAPFYEEDTVTQAGYSSSLTPNTSHHLFPDEITVMGKLPTGWNINSFAKHCQSQLPPKFKAVWDRRISEMPFSLHCMLRLDARKFSPTLFSGSRRYVHPFKNRGLTLAEFSSIMGWPAGMYPIGHDAVPQLAKGVVPAVGKWLAEQVLLSASGHWGTDDWESEYCHKTSRWLGTNTADKKEKTINLSHWYPHNQDWSRFPDFVLKPFIPVPDGVTVRGALDNSSVKGQVTYDV